MTTAARFDRQVKDEYKLVVRVFDNGSPALSTDVIVSIKLIEESAFPPIVLAPLSIHVTVSGDVYKGGVIGQVRAEDRDPFDTLRYEVVSNNAHLFAIDLGSGVLEAVELLDAGDYKINVSITDGKFVIYTQVQLTIHNVDPSMAENAVVMRFEEVTPQDFVSNYQDKLIQTLSLELGGRNSAIIQVMILSIQPATDEIVEPWHTRQKRQEPQQDLDVLLAVKKLTNTTRAYYRGNSLRRKILAARNTIEHNLDIVLLDVFNDVCSKDACVEGVCATEVLFDTDHMTQIATEKSSFVTPSFQMSFICKCKAGYGGPICGEEVDVCSSNQCPPPRLCKSSDDGMDYICECPDGRSGPDCQHSSLPSHCVDNAGGQGCQGKLQLFYYLSLSKIHNNNNNNNNDNDM